MARPGRNAQERVSLLLNLIGYLTKNGATSIQDLAERFDARPDDIRSMVMFIGTAGVPGDSQAYLHQDLYDIDWDALELEDIVELKHVVGVDGTPRFTSMQAAALLAGLRALRDVLTVEETEIAASAEAKLREASVLEGASLSLRDERDPLAGRIALVREAIRTLRRVSFAYVGRDGEVTSRVADPHRLLQLQGAWYVEAWCHSREATRTFRLEFMGELATLDLPQQHPTMNPSPRPVRVPSTHGLEVELLVDEESLYRIESWNPTVSRSGTRGRRRVRVRLVDEARVIQLVSQAPGQIEVVAPPSARSLVADWAASLAQAYSQNVTSDGSVH